MKLEGDGLAGGGFGILGLTLESPQHAALQIEKQENQGGLQDKA
jgi:hypothetical protein